MEDINKTKTLRAIIATVSLVFAIQSHGQIPIGDPIDTVLLRVEYKMKYIETKEDSTYSEDLYCLNIGKKMSCCYSNVKSYTLEQFPADILKAIETRKSIDTLKMVGSALQKEMGTYKTFECSVYKNYPKSGFMGSYYMITNGKISPSSESDHLYNVEEIPSYNWNMEDGDTIICNYHCQKASTAYNGRIWNVYYAPELPFQDGPWKLGGLPGLILKAEDVTKEFCFEAFEIGRPKSIPHVRLDLISEPSSVYKKAQPDRIKKLIELRYKNVEGYLRLTHGNDMVDQLIKMDIKFDQTPRTACLIEDMKNN